MPRMSASREPAPLVDADIEQLEALLDAVPAPLEPLDITALDGFVAAIVLRRPPLPAAQWLPFVTDIDGRAPPEGFDASALHALVLRRHGEVERAVERRRWFDPWVFELEPPAAASQALIGWVAGFASALERFPNAALAGGEAVPPLALLYHHLDADDLEDASEELLAEIEALEPAADLAEGVEDLVCATLLLADVSRPIAHAGRRAPRR